jgi:uncharacterized membrane protein
MTKDAFLAQLRAGLRGMPPRAIDEIVTDYASHFDEGLAAGRSEEAVAAALGDPARLARELNAEAGLKRWDEERSPSAAAGAILAILSIGAIDLLILLPILLVVISLVVVVACMAIGFMVAGLALLVTTPFALFGGHLPKHLLLGLGFMTGGLSLGALVTLVCVGLTDLLIRYGRFHVRLMKPIAE